MELRTALSEWIDKSFGPVHIGDFFTMEEQVSATKEERVYQRKIVISLLKHEGFKKDWTSEETFERWKEKIKEMVEGDVLKLDIKCAEDNELRYVAGIRSGEKGEEEFGDAKGRVFSYRFNISLIKRVKRHEG